MSFFKRLFGQAHKTDPQALLETMLTFIQARTWDESQRILGEC